MLSNQTVQDAAWRELRAALETINRIPAQLLADDAGAIEMLVDDARRYIGSVALLMSDGPDAVGYAKMLRAVDAMPRFAADADYIERLGGSIQPDPAVWQAISDAVDLWEANHARP